MAGLRFIMLHNWKQTLSPSREYVNSKLGGVHFYSTVPAIVWLQSISSESNGHRHRDDIQDLYSLWLQAYFVEESTPHWVINSRKWKTFQLPVSASLLRSPDTGLDSSHYLNQCFFFNPNHKGMPTSQINEPRKGNKESLFLSVKDSAWVNVKLKGELFPQEC